jgi:hypothetical protein
MNRTDSGERPDDRLDAIEATERPTATRLQAERPIPAPAFRGRLRRHLLEQTRGGAYRPSFGGFSVRTLAAGYLGAGLILLVVAGVGLAGGGPFAT